MELYRTIRTALVCASLTIGVALTATAAVSASASDSTQVYEVHYVPTVGDTVVRVEIVREARYDAGKQPVLLTYSPYNSLGEPRPADDSLADRYVPRGYARDGLFDPAPGDWQRARVTMLPQDYTVSAGHRLGLLVQGSSTVDLATGRVPTATPVGSRLRLPTVE